VRAQGVGIHPPISKQPLHLVVVVVVVVVVSPSSCRTPLKPRADSEEEWSTFISQEDFNIGVVVVVTAVAAVAVAVLAAGCCCLLLLLLAAVVVCCCVGAERWCCCRVIPCKAPPRHGVGRARGMSATTTATTTTPV